MHDTPQTGVAVGRWIGYLECPFCRKNGYPPSSARLRATFSSSPVFSPRVPATRRRTGHGRKHPKASNLQRISHQTSTGRNLQEVETREPRRQRIAPLHRPGFIPTELSRIEWAVVWISRYWKGTFIRFTFVFSLILMVLSSCSLGPGGRRSTTLDDGVRV